MRPAWCRAFKSPRSGRKVSMQINGFDFSVEVDGKRIPEYGHQGKTYVEGRRSRKYQIKFRNNRSERVLVVPSVDGLSVIDGKPATSSSSGYVVEAYSSLTISGWRTSLSEVREFEFSGKGSSFAGKTEGEQNCGVIGAQVFSEVRHYFPSGLHLHTHTIVPLLNDDLWGGTTGKPPGQPYLIRANLMHSGPMKSLSAEPTSTLSATYASNSVNAGAPDFNLGTGYGNAVQDSVRETNFEKSVCVASFELFYSDAKGLAKAGIQVDKSPTLSVFPKAFSGFCKMPD